MLLETCRYQLIDGKIVTKMFGMKNGDWDIEPGWHHSPKDAKAAAEAPKPAKKVDGRSKAARQSKAMNNGNSSRSDQQLS